MNKKSTSQIASFLVFGLITWGMVSCNSSDTQHNPITNSETTQPTQKKEVVETDPSISISNGQAVIRYEMTPEDFVSSKEILITRLFSNSELTKTETRSFIIVVNGQPLYSNGIVVASMKQTK